MNPTFRSWGLDGDHGFDGEVPAQPAPGKVTLTERLWQERAPQARRAGAELAGSVVASTEGGAAWADDPFGLHEPAALAAGAMTPRPEAGWSPGPPAGAVQADGGALFADDPFALHELAAGGVTGGGAPLPHLEALQASFGHHDLTGVRAHVGGPAASAARAIGAAAYASGDDVAFAAAPDLRQAAHEAAHVVQQRGGVRLDGGVGQAGDPFERHADAVAELVVGGQSAEALLDTMAHRGAGGGPAVQREAWDYRAANAIELLRTREGLTLGGAPIERSGSQFHVRHGGYRYEVRISGDNVGLLYGGAPAQTETAFDTIVATPGLYDAGQLAVARALRPHIRSEGAVDSINTWDTMGLTLAGRGRTEAPELLHRAARIAGERHVAAGDLATGEALAQHLIPGTRDNRFDFTRIEQLIGILQASRQAVVMAKIEDGMLRFYEGTSGPTRTADGIDAADRAEVGTATEAGRLDEVVITVAVHLNLGGHTRFRDPMGAVRRAMERYPVDTSLRPRDFANLSRQVAFLIKQRAEAWAADDPEVEEYPGIWMYQKAQDFNNYFLHRLPEEERGDTHAIDLDGHMAPAPRAHRENRAERFHNFFDIAAANEVIPCWTSISGLTGQAAAPEGRIWLRVSPTSRRDSSHRGRYYDFGDPVEAATPVAAPTEASTDAAEHPSLENPAGSGIQQRRVSPDGGTAIADGAAHAYAAAGLAGTDVALPHADAIAASFGHHDVSGLRAHVGGPAAAAAEGLGARAYAYGDRVAFAAAPDLRQAAHEVAHVVQQRGGVRLDGGVGRAGDPYERHADAVAELVVGGQSAEALLDTMAHRGAGGGPAVQRLDDTEVTGNVVGLTSTGTSGRLDERSRRRLWERLAELGFADAARADSFTDADLRTAITAFQDSELARPALDHLEAADDVRDSDGDLLYEDDVDDDRATRPASARHERRAGFTVGGVRVNDLTVQALANAWPQTVLGRSMSEDQCYQALAAIVAARGLTFAADRVNVIGMRGYQGGAIHDNDPELIYTDDNVYNDTIFIVWTDDAGGHHVYQARATVDPGGPAAEPAADDDTRFMVAADQAWSYRGFSRGRSHKFDRAEYDPVRPTGVERGRLYTEHPELLAEALGAPGSGAGRVIYRAPRDRGAGNRADGGAVARGTPHAVETDRTSAGGARLVSALHSGASGSSHGDRVFGDSVGCSVVHGRWFAGFNEALRRAATDSGADPGRIEFTYSLIDPSMFAAAELDRLLDPIAARTTASGDERSR